MTVDEPVDLTAKVARRVGELEVDLDISVAAGETLAVMGPNGAGKTSLLRMVCGLLPLERGRIALGDRVLDCPADGVFVPPGKRSTGMVFQDYLLFDHLSALENVAFGLRARGADRRSARSAAMEWLDRFGLGSLAQSRTTALSGGQRQRVALARALAIEPRMLLLDEPVAAVDASARTEIRRELTSHLSSVDAVRILVTHDPLDAFALADRLVVIEDGRITQSGTLTEVTNAPRSAYVADLIGRNLLAGRANGATFEAVSGLRLVLAEHRTSGPAYASIRAQAIVISRAGGHSPATSSQRNHIDATVLEIEHLGERSRVRLASPVDLTAEITTDSIRELGLAVGDPVVASIKATEVEVYDR